MPTAAPTFTARPNGRDEFDLPVYLSDGGDFTVDGNGYGRMRWTVAHTCGWAGIVDSRGEAIAWATDHTC